MSEEQVVTTEAPTGLPKRWYVVHAYSGMEKSVQRALQERIERESGLDILQTAPNVTYEVVTRDGKVVEVERPSHLPDASLLQEFRDPLVQLSVLFPPPASRPGAGREPHAR